MLRSVQSIMELIVSAPITMTMPCAPLSISLAPTWSAYKKPEQAAPRSKPHAWGAPIFSCTRQAVAGNGISGLTVATMMTSTASAEMPRSARHSRAASAARSLVATPGSTRWRSRMPVRSTIHSSEVSTIVSRSALVSTRGGT